MTTQQYRQLRPRRQRAKIRTEEELAAADAAVRGTRLYQWFQRWYYQPF